MLYGERSAVWDQAENRLHAQKALLRDAARGGLGRVYPEIHLGPLTLQTFGLMFALAFLAAGALIAKRLREIGKPVDWAYEMGFSALAGGIVGSRIYFIVQNYDSVKHDLLGNLFSGSGLVWYGGAIGGALAVLLWAWYRRLPRPGPARPLRAGAGARLRDRPLRLPALRRRRLRQGLERALGDVLSQRHRADRRNRPPDADLRDAGDGARRLGPLAAARPLPRRRPLRDLPRSTPGAERFLVEFLRRNDDVALGLTAAQLESLGMMVAGVVWICVVKRRHGNLGRDGAPHPAAAQRSRFEAQREAWR